MKLSIQIQGLRRTFQKELHIEEGQVARIGRVEDNDLSIRDQKISRHHLELEIHQGNLLVRDRGSKFGTYVDGEKVKEPFLWDEQEVLTLGDTQISYEVLSRVSPGRSQSSPQYSSHQGKELIARDHSEIAHADIEEALRFYTDQDLTPYLRRKQLKSPDKMVRLLLRTLFVPFAILFGLFIAFPTFFSCLITLAYAGVALILSNNLLAKSEERENFSLPLTKSIEKLQHRITEKIERMPEEEQDLFDSILDEINGFVEHRLPKMESHIYTLNQSLVPGMQERLLRKRQGVEKKLETVDDERLAQQLERNLKLMDKQINLHDRIRNLLTSLIFKMEDFQSQLEILEATLVAQRFRQAPIEFTNNFYELQKDIDEFYEEYNRLDPLDLQPDPELLEQR